MDVWSRAGTESQNMRSTAILYGFRLGLVSCGLEVHNLSWALANFKVLLPRSHLSKSSDVPTMSAGLQS